MVVILQKEAPVLRGKAEPVNKKDFGSPRLKKILAQMVVALDKQDDGIAIAAPQIGVPLRIFIVSHRAFEFAAQEEGVSPENLQTANSIGSGQTNDAKQKYQNLVFINPEITKLSRKKHWAAEGCLSVRWLYGEVSRAEKATVRGFDENGKPFTRGGSGLLAQVFQHETDHLNGVLFIDKARNVEKITQQEMQARESQALKRGS